MHSSAHSSAQVIHQPIHQPIISSFISPIHQHKSFIFPNHQRKFGANDSQNPKASSLGRPLGVGLCGRRCGLVGRLLRLLKCAALFAQRTEQDRPLVRHNTSFGLNSRFHLVEAAFAQVSARLARDLGVFLGALPGAPVGSTFRGPLSSPPRGKEPI